MGCKSGDVQKNSRVIQKEVRVRVRVRAITCPPTTSIGERRFESGTSGKAQRACVT
jgi:hypothetical protein